MGIEINEDILKKTTKCKKKFSCLYSKKKDICKVIYCARGKVHYIKCRTSKDCDYKISFGEHLICSCPVRREIYNNYKIQFFKV